MTRTRARLAVIVTASLLAVTTTMSGAPALAQDADSFAIAYGDTVADGVPAPGAGNIEVGGATDAYTFAGAAGDVPILDVLAGSNTTFLWSLAAPDRTVLFDGLYVDRSATLPETGTYILTVRGASATSVGTYSFRLLLTPAPEEFTVAFGDTVSDGVPAPGAGSIEVPGAVDRYLFDATAGQVAILDALSGTNDVRWSLHAPDGTEELESIFTDLRVTLDQTGTYTLAVFGFNLTRTGTYSFRLLEAPAAQEFTIALGDTVSDGVPAPGAGNLEAAGALDRYRFDATAGQVAIFDALSGSTNVVRWALHAPDGSEVFNSLYVDRQVTLAQTGTYTLTVSGLAVTSSGVYSFRLVEVPPRVDEFTIAFGDTVSDGVPGPGAGNLEGPGALDRYRFDATPGQVAVLDALSGSINEVRWALHAPDGSEVFDSLYVDRQVTLAQTGTYTLTVSGLTVTSFGVYSFQLREAPANTAPVALDDMAGTDFQTPLTIDVLANDTDVDGDPLAIDSLTQPANGTAAITGNEITYTPDAGFTGTDTFTYTVSDGRGGTAQATVTVTVAEPPNTPPTIDDIDDQTSTAGDQVDLQVHADDPDGDALTYTADGLPPGLDIDPATGHLTGTIETGAETGSPYHVTIAVTDPDGATATTDFGWTVHPADDAPVAVDLKILPVCLVNDGFGVIPVIIFGSDDIPAAQIDPATVALEGMPVQRLFGWYLVVVHDLNGDGLDDMLVLIDDVAGAIPDDATSATLTGQLFDGTAFEGTDDICLLHH